MHFNTSSTLSGEGVAHDVLCAPAYIDLVPRGGGVGEEGGGGEGVVRGRILNAYNSKTVRSRALNILHFFEEFCLGNLMDWR